MGPEDLSESEHEVLKGLGDHQQTSKGAGGSFAEVAVHVRGLRSSTPEDNVEREVIDGLESLERKGYVTKAGETKDALKAPIYEVSPEGWKRLNR